MIDVASTLSCPYLQGPPDAFYFIPSVIVNTGLAAGADTLLTPGLLKVGSGVVYAEMGLGKNVGTT